MAFYMASLDKDLFKSAFLHFDPSKSTSNFLCKFYFGAPLRLQDKKWYTMVHVDCM